MAILFSVAHSLLGILVALNIRSTPPRILGCSLIVGLIAADIVATRTGNALYDYVLGATLATVILQAIHYLLLTRPLEEFRHGSDEIPAYKLPFIERYFWLSSITPRGIGWSFADNSCLPPVHPQHLTRLSFVVSRLCRTVVHYFLFEAAVLYVRYNPVFASLASLASQGYLLRCLNIAAIPCQAYAALNCIHSVLAVIAVSMTVQEPKLWPTPFGHLVDAYTVQRFWGRTWHQFCRYCLTVFGPRIRDQPPSSSSSDQLRKSKQQMTSYLRLCNAFVCSAFIHLCGDVVLQCRIWGNSSPSEINLPNVIGISVPFYLKQPFAVLMEGVAMEIGKQLGLTNWMDNLKDALRAAYPAQEWGGLGDRTTVTEALVNRLFGVDLALTMSTWFTNTYG
ncbi:hypothetical protein ID866_9825 [Astraeus odoratus]|nr:hypothetical protein ID866_9825 [Astraeus odoratus]